MKIRTWGRLLIQIWVVLSMGSWVLHYELPTSFNGVEVAVEERRVWQILLWAVLMAAWHAPIAGTTLDAGRGWRSLRQTREFN